jgi:hypothetical protein
MIAHIVETPIKSRAAWKSNEDSNRKANISRDTIYIRDDSSRDVSSKRNARYNRKVSNKQQNTGCQRADASDSRNRLYGCHKPTILEYPQKLEKNLKLV